MKKKNGKAILIGLAIMLANYGIASAEEAKNLSPDQALKKLIAGNERFVNFKLQHPDLDKARLVELAKGQNPFAVILGCSDSRIPPELVFDQGLGDLFVIRDAGNVLNNEVIGSAEYAVEHLGTPLIVVLGHKKCGAVTAAVNGVAQPCHIQSLVKDIQPAVNAAKKQTGDTVDNAIRDNVNLVVDELKSSEPIIKELVKENKVKVIGAYYDISTGKVEIINP